MMTLSPTSALMLYLCFTLGVLMSLWAFSHWKGRKKTILTSEQELFQCEYCAAAYMASSAKGVSKCPECHSFNKENRYKKR